VRNGVGISTALDLIARRESRDEALKVPVSRSLCRPMNFAICARARCRQECSRRRTRACDVLANILQRTFGRSRRLGALQHEKYSEAVTHLKKATEMLPAETPAWRSALWHLGVDARTVGPEGAGARRLHQEL
jgi:hypothetical protein